MNKSDVAVIGLGVMGSNLAINLASRGYHVSVFNRHPERVRDFLAKLEKDFGAGSPYATPGGRYDYDKLKENLTTAFTFDQLMGQLAEPRRIILMVKAGEAVDEMLVRLRPRLSDGDVVIDGGNSFYEDTERRCTSFRGTGIHFIGCGISGGADGALHGPSIMAGGDEKGWSAVCQMLTEAAAVAPTDGRPCCLWMGKGGAGHFVKMVHNGIEYAEMEAIAEIFDLMKRGLNIGYWQIAEVLSQWEQADEGGYLLEITTRILQKKTEECHLLDAILDVAHQKGTGRWCISAAMNYDTDVSLLSAAVMQRSASAQKELRTAIAESYRIDDLHPLCTDCTSSLPSPQEHTQELSAPDTESMRKAFKMCKMLIFSQGFSLLHTASRQEDYGLSLEDAAAVWRAGCILRSPLLERLKGAFHYDPQCPSLLLAGIFRNELPACVDALKSVVAFANSMHIPCPVLSTALQYFLTMATARLPLYLTQAQRDYFGAHQVERTDRPRGEMFHLEWEETVL